MIRLFVTTAACPRCERRPPVRVTEPLMDLARQVPGDVVLMTQECNRPGCPTTFAVRARHVLAAQTAGAIQGNPGTVPVRPERKAA